MLDSPSSLSPRRSRYSASPIESQSLSSGSTPGAKAMPGPGASRLPHTSICSSGRSIFSKAPRSLFFGTRFQPIAARCITIAMRGRPSRCASA
jgi:hypothetical protein